MAATGTKAAATGAASRTTGAVAAAAMAAVLAGVATTVATAATDRMDVKRKLRWGCCSEKQQQNLAVLIACIVHIAAQ